MISHVISVLERQSLKHDYTVKVHMRLQNCNHVSDRRVQCAIGAKHSGMTVYTYSHACSQSPQAVHIYNIIYIRCCGVWPPRRCQQVLNILHNGIVFLEY